MKKILTLALVALLSMGMLCSCGDSADENAADENNATSVVAEQNDGENSDNSADDITGEWVLTSIVEADGKSYTLEEYAAAKGVDAGGIEATYNFKEDGSADVALGGISTPMTYTFDGKIVTYTVTESGASGTMEYDANEKTLTASDANTGMKSICTKK